jgi:DNA polymerase-3 subunit gamma/tau
LYRTYRPATFSEVIGQDHVTTPLMRALASDRTHHAYLFSGPRGCGKTSSARILARSLNCATGPTAEPCGKCASCIDLAPNGPGSLDVIELDAASNRGIDQARELREQAMYAPAGSRYRIYIIDEAHQLTTEAANALLKLVEEPPPHLRFVFATTEPEKLLGTIRSRTHHYPFRLVPTSVLQEHLAKVCAAEKVKADPAALALAAKAGAGSVRDALSILGQLVGGAGKDGITYDDAVTQLGFTSDVLLDEVIAALIDSDGDAMFKTIEKVVTGGHDSRRFATDLLERLRDLIILSAAPDAAEHGLVAQPSDRLVVLRAQADSLGPASLSRAADLVSDGITALRGATSPRLHLELLGARLLVTAVDTNPAALIARLEQLERRVASGVSAAPAAVSSVSSTVSSTPAVSAPSAPPKKLSAVAPATSAAPAVSSVSEASDESAQQNVVESPVVSAAPAVEKKKTSKASGGSVDIASIQALWPAVIEAVKAVPGGGRIAFIAASNGWPTSATDSELIVTYKHLGPFNMVKTRGFASVFEAAVAQVVGRQFSVVVAHDADAILPDGPMEDEAPASIEPKPLSEGQKAMARVKEEVAAAADEVVDEPSMDDDVVDDVSGAELLASKFGATVIEEYETDSRRS